MGQVVLASVEPGMAFECEGRQYVKTEEMSHNCYKCTALDGSQGAFWSNSRLVTIL